MVPADTYLTRLFIRARVSVSLKPVLLSESYMSLGSLDPGAIRSVLSDGIDPSGACVRLRRRVSATYTILRNNVGG